MNILPKALLLLAILLVSFHCCYGRRSGRSRGRGTRHHSSYRFTRTKSTYSYIPKPSHFDKGGLMKFAKMGAALYVAKKLTPSVNFHPHFGIATSRRPYTYCYDCLSINGSDPECESLPGNSTSSLGKCWTTTSRPYCSVEHGVLSNDQKFVRRSCQERRCRSCSTDHQIPGTCHTFQCDLCNWSKCNKGHVRDVFSDDWEGCIPNPSKTSYTFDTKHTCGVIAMKSGYSWTFAVVLSMLYFS